MLVVRFAFAFRVMQQVRNMGPRAHVQLRRNPFQGHRRQIERGYKVPTVDVLLRIAKRLKVRFRDIVSEL